MVCVAVGTIFRSCSRPVCSGAQPAYESKNVGPSTVLKEREPPVLAKEIAALHGVTVDLIEYAIPMNVPGHVTPDGSCTEKKCSWNVYVPVTGAVNSAISQLLRTLALPVRNVPSGLNTCRSMSAPSTSEDDPL